MEFRAEYTKTQHIALKLISVKKMQEKQQISKRYACYLLYFQRLLEKSEWHEEYILISKFWYMNANVSDDVWLEF